MLSRRDLLKIILSTPLLLTACDNNNNVTTTEQNNLIHAFGLSQQHDFKKIYAAGAPAEVLLYSLVPERMVGWSAKKSPEVLKFLATERRHLPYLGSINGRGSTVSLETLISAEVDLIIDIGTVNQTYLSTAKKVSQQTNIPYLLVDGRLDKAAEQFTQVGSLINAPRASILADYATEILQFADKIRAKYQGNKKTYYARSPSGLETGQQHSIHTEVIELLGCQNVAASLGEGGLAHVSMEQIIAWQPDIILTQDQAFYQAAVHNTLWQQLAAINNKQFFLIPKWPYGWIDGPPGINRLLGIYYLTYLIFPQEKINISEKISAFFEHFYQVKLTEQQIAELLIG